MNQFCTVTLSICRHVSRHPPDAENFEVAVRLLENLSTRIYLFIYLSFKKSLSQNIASNGGMTGK